MTCIEQTKSIWECNDYLIENGVDGVVYRRIKILTFYVKTGIILIN